MTLQSVIDEKVEVAKQEGIKKGLSQGRAIERANVVYALHKKGMDIADIASVTNISVAKVKKIISSRVKN